MDLTHRFSVPAPIDDAWRAFNNLESLAPCFPGATITGIEGDDFSGTVKIKLGPIALMYSGTGRYVERDAETRRVVIEARGKDKRGNGTATATVSAAFSENGGQTDVTVSTDLAITGKPAQFGRGVISDISDKLLDQFVTCVSGQFTDGLGNDLPEPDEIEMNSVESAAVEPAPEEVPVETDPTVEFGAAPEEVLVETDPTIALGAAPEEVLVETDPTIALGAAPEEVLVETDPTIALGAAPEEVLVETDPTIALGAAPEELDGDATGVGSTEPEAGQSSGEVPTPQPSPGPSPRPPTTPAAAPPSDFNALTTIGPVLLKRFGPPAAVIAVLLVIISKIIKRRR